MEQIFQSLSVMLMGMCGVFIVMAAISLAIVVTGLLTVIAAPLLARLAG